MPSTLKLDDPAQLAAAVPSLLGFVPDAGSLIVVTLRASDQGRRQVALTVRADHPGVSQIAALARSLTGTIARSQPETVALIVIGWNTATGDADELYWRLLDGDHGWELLDCLTVQEHDGRWRVLDTCRAVVDPAWRDLGEDLLRPLAIAETGAVVHDSRDAIAELFEPTGEPDPLCGLVPFGIRSRDYWLAEMARLDADALGERLNEFAGAARVTAGEDRDNLLTCAATAAYLRGDGATASVALGYCTPGHTMSELLRQALAAAVPPDVLRGMLTAA